MMKSPKKFFISAVAGVLALVFTLGPVVFSTVIAEPRETQIVEDIVKARGIDPGDTEARELIRDEVLQYGFDTHQNLKAVEVRDQAARNAGISGFITQIERVLNYIIPFLIGLAVFIIIYGILGYISHAADEEKRKEARAFIVWGIIGVFMMLSVWGFVSILINTFNLNRSSTIATDIYRPLPVPSKAPTDVIEFINLVNAVGSRIIPFLVGIGVVIVIFGTVNYIRQADNEEKRAEGRMFIIWGIVSIFVMLSIWGFVNILVNTFQLNNQVPNIPALPTIK